VKPIRTGKKLIIKTDGSMVYNRRKSKMKKILVILVALIGFGISANAQCGVSTDWKKDGQNGSGSSTWGFTCYVNCYNSNSYDVTIRVKVKAVHLDGDIKYLSETFTIKANSNKTTTQGKYAILDTKWASQVDQNKSEITVECL
jgi:hypothetical protein